MDASGRRETVQEQLETGEFDRQPFGSPEYGTVFELLACERYALEWIDGPIADAVTEAGDRVQIKACRLTHSNGPGRTAHGRWDLWRDTVDELLPDDEDDADEWFLLGVYSGDVDPSDVTLDEWDEFVHQHALLHASEVAARIPRDAWHEAHRGKGERARLSWPHVFDEDEVL